MPGNGGKWDRPGSGAALAGRLRNPNHERLVEVSRALRWNHGFEFGLDLTFRFHSVNGLFDHKKAGPHPEQVAVHGQDALGEGHAQDGTASVVADAWQRSKDPAIIRNASLMFRGDNLRRLMESAGPGVIAQPLPEGERFVLGSGG